MSNFGGKHSAFEKDFAVRFKRLDGSLDKIENKILKILSESMNNPKTSSVYWNKVRKDIDVQYARMVAVFDDWAKKEIPLAYRRSIRSMSKRINATKNIANVASKNTIQMIHSF